MIKLFRIFLFLYVAIFLSWVEASASPTYPFHSPEIKQDMVHMLNLLIGMEESVYGDKVGYSMLDVKAEELNPDWKKLREQSIELREVLKQIGEFKDKNIYPDLVKTLSQKLDTFETAIAAK